MKNAAKLGASAVPMLHPKKSTAVVQVIYKCARNRGQHDSAHFQPGRFCYSKSTNPRAHTRQCSTVRWNLSLSPPLSFQAKH